MTPNSYRKKLVGLAGVLCVLASGVAAREFRAIRLREGAVRPWEAPGEASGAVLSGLYLVQLSGPIQPAWREALQQAGVSLVAYVPEDTFVARMQGVPVAALTAMDYVSWWGRYRPEHKLHRGVAADGPRARADDGVGVSVILARGAEAGEVARVRGRFRREDQQAHHRFGSVLRGYLPRRQLAALAESPVVLWVEPYQGMQLFDEVAAKIVAGDGGFQTTRMQVLGYDGAGVTVAVADSGLDDGDPATMHPDLFGRVAGIFHYGALTDGSDGHSHGTHVAGIVAGNGATGETDPSGALYGLGVAPGASIISQRIFDAAGGYEPPPTFERLTRDAVSGGAVIGSNSWGDDTQGRYDSFAAEFDALVRDADAETPGDQPYILEFSAGNAGPGRQSIGSPAVAKNVIATGASQNNRFDSIIYVEGQEAMADFSSRGPAEDGRIKPDVVAPGTWIASLKSSSASDQYAWESISGNYQYQGGTSQAGPQVSGAAAVFVQYYRSLYGGATPSPALVKAALINSAVDMAAGAGTAPVPNQDEGWGRVDLDRLIESGRDVEFLDQTFALEVEDVYEGEWVVSSRDVPLRITLAYTDVPGFPGAIPALVNDLDLEVVGPDGRVYRGNHFVQGESIPDTPAGDAVNNVEGVHLAEPLPGIYVVRVRAHNVAEDAVAATPAIDQDFALVVSGRFLPPGASTVFFDRSYYTVPDAVAVTVLDRDQAAAPAVQVAVGSGTEPDTETLTLWPAGPGGVFTNRLSTATGTAAGDGVLQVDHGDAILGVYQDLSAGLARTAVAEADLVAPVIDAVEVSERFGRTFVSWRTDEPAGGRVGYGTNTLVLQTQEVPGFLTAQEAALDGLVPGLTYYLRVSATDRAGNTSTNDNGGALFMFVAPEAPGVLVVDAFFDDFFFEPPPPLTNYTDPLDALDIDYDVWEVLLKGSPALEDLKPYRVLLWRLPEVALLSSRPTFTAAERVAVRQYLDEGGSLFVASMEAATRLDEAAHAEASRGDGTQASEPFRLSVCWSPYEWMTRDVEALERPDESRAAEGGEREADDEVET